MKLLKGRQVAEVLLAVAAVAAAERLLGSDPFFSSLWGAPYTLLPAVFAAYYGGQGAALSTLGIATVWAAEALSGASLDGLRLAVGTLAGGVLAGISLSVRSLLTEQRGQLLARIRNYVGRTRRLEKENAVLAEVCRELEGRITRERKSLTYLLTKLERIESSTLAGAWEEILDAVRTFTGATQASIWQYEASTNLLRLAAHSGWPPSDGVAPVDAAQGILGWVARNGTPFSYRMAAQSPLFASWDHSRNILTYPVRVRDETWGVLNVEALPFAAYSRQAETFLEVILKIAERPLRGLVERDRERDLADTHPETGVASSTTLIRRLETELKRIEAAGGRFSLVVLEVANAGELRRSLGAAAWMAALADLAGVVTREAGPSGPVYHHRNEAQLAFVLLDRDSDGTALACLELLGLLQSQAWRSGETPFVFEIRVGFATTRRGELHAETLMRRAEDLLRLQETQ